uniref:Glycoprotein H n=1 Tax=Anatid alphaherpesvirus 2 TaxID=3080522 RepID=A0AAU0K6I8_9ALPH
MLISAAVASAYTADVADDARVNRPTQASATTAAMNALGHHHVRRMALNLEEEDDEDDYAPWPDYDDDDSGGPHWDAERWASGVTLSTVMRTDDNGLSLPDLHNLNWSMPDAVFVLVSYPDNPSRYSESKLGYLPLALAAKLDFLTRPRSRLLRSGNVVQYINTGSYPGNPYIDTTLPHSLNMVVSNGSLGATLETEPEQPTGSNPPRTLNDVTADDMTSDGVGPFILTSDLILSNPKPTCFIDPMATVSPVSYKLLRVVRFGSDAAEVIMKFGQDFSSLLISMKEATPVQLVLVRRSASLAILWPSYYSHEPIHTEPVTPFKTYVLGSGIDPSDGEYKTMVDLATCADESLDPIFQSAQLHVAMLTFAEGQPTSGDDTYFFRLVVARLWMTLFSSVQHALASGSENLNRALDNEADLKMAADAMMRLALAGDAKSHFIDGGSPLTSGPKSDVVKKNLAEGVRRLVASDGTGSGAPMENVRKALRTAYAVDAHVDAGTLSVDVKALATKVVAALHDEAVRETLTWNASARHSAFYAFSLLTYRPPPDKADEAYATARRAILIATSMCTEEHIASSEINVQEAYARVASRKGPFHILDTYTPCASSLRFDLADYAHRIYASWSLASSPTLNAYLGARPDGRAAAEDALADAAERVMTKWRTKPESLLSSYVAELVACEQRPLRGALMVLPIATNASYVLTRRADMSGLTYRIDGVSVSTPLYLTYVTGECVSNLGTIPPVLLPRPAVGECPYCGCVLLRYSASGTVRHSVYIADSALQSELIASGNSSVRFFNPSQASAYGTSLLLFPNGTVVRILAFESQRVFVVSATYISIAVAGTILAVAVVVITVKMIISYTRDSRGYDALSEYDDDV